METLLVEVSCLRERDDTLLLHRDVWREAVRLAESRFFSFGYQNLIPPGEAKAFAAALNEGLSAESQLRHRKDIEAIARLAGFGYGLRITNLTGDNSRRQKRQFEAQANTQAPGVEVSDAPHGAGRTPLFVSHRIFNAAVDLALKGGGFNKAFARGLRGWVGGTVAVTFGHALRNGLRAVDRAPSLKGAYTMRDFLNEPGNREAAEQLASFFIGAGKAGVHIITR